MWIPHIFQSVNGSTFAPIATATVSNGAYQYTYAPADLGSYQFKAVWAGNDAYSSSESTAVSVSIVIPPTSLSDYWLYYVIAVLGIILLAIIVYLIRSRK